MLGRSRLDFESEPGSIPVGAIVETGTAWGVPAAGEPAYFIFASQYRASACWYFCWYRQQSTMKIASNSNG